MNAYHHCYDCYGDLWDLDGIVDEYETRELDGPLDEIEGAVV